MPQTAKAYSSKLYDAIELAARAHHRQVRKGTEVPYVVHPLAVAGILIRAKGPEPLVIAGVLHDTIEDTPVTIDEIRFQFGQAVADLVLGLSEPDKQASWEDRKSHTLEHLRHTATEDVLLVSIADKLDNIRAIREGLEADGESFWLRFNRPKDLQAWYYLNLADVFSRRIINEPGTSLLKLFLREVRLVFDRKKP